MAVDTRERLAAAILPYLFPSWPGRWGWTEAGPDMKRACMVRADEIIDSTSPAEVIDGE